MFKTNPISLTLVTYLIGIQSSQRKEAWSNIARAGNEHSAAMWHMRLVLLRAAGSDRRTASLVRCGRSGGFVYLFEERLGLCLIE